MEPACGLMIMKRRVSPDQSDACARPAKAPEPAAVSAAAPAAEPFRNVRRESGLLNLNFPWSVID